MYITSMNAHVPVPRGPVVQSLPADWTFLPLLGVSHPRRLEFLHVIVQLHLRLQQQD